ncbi:J domain-containing protein [Pseudomonas phoenicis]|uniref:J domain-containing protein n=1 Tax=unclassified Pseudomonas TaxID=196821 RepID=UPI0039A1EC40
MHWKTLGLARDADERAIKRAYARLLKIHRPDEDPAAFQRLREAYEGALEQARWRERHTEDEAEDDVDVDVDVNGARPRPVSGAMDLEVPPPLSAPAHPIEAMDDVDKPLPAAAPAPATATATAALDIAASIETLLDGDLDLGLAQARQAGLENAFERHLLRRCVQRMDFAALDWAQSRLDWLSAMQAPHLPMVELEALADRLATRLLGQLREAMAQGRHPHALELMRTALASAWLAPLDRRTRFQERLADLLLHAEGWPPAFFEQVCALNGWDETLGHLPGDAGQWQILSQRQAGFQWEASLRERLALPPADAAQRAAWFLFADLAPAQRRQWADRFTLEDWQACAGLEEVLAIYPQLPERLRRTAFVDWRAWSPRGYWGWAHMYTILLLWSVLSAMMVTRADGDDSLLLTVGIPLAFASLLVGVGHYVLRLWAKVARARVSADVELSLRLLPRNLVRQGNGVLVLRHLLPCLLPTALVSVWSLQLPPVGWLLGPLTLLGAVRFVDVVTRGDSPAAWLQRAWWHVPLSDSVLKQGLIMLGGLLLMIVFSLVFT